MKTTTIHDVSKVINPVADGVLSWTIGNAELATIAGTKVTWVLTVPAKDVFVTDAWVDLITPLSPSNVSILIGDADGDDTYLLPVQIGSVAVAGRHGLDQDDKGQKLKDHRSALVDTQITVTLDGKGGSIASATGEVRAFVKFAEIDRTGHNDSAFTASAVTGAGEIGPGTGGGGATGELYMSDGTVSDVLVSGETLTIEGGGATTVALDADTNIFTVTAAPTWTISGDTGTETIAHGDTLTVAGSGATSTAYDASTNTLTITSSSGGSGTTTWTASDGTNSSTIVDGDTLKIVGSADTTVAYDASTETYTISTPAAPISSITVNDGLIDTGTSAVPIIGVDDAGTDNFVKARTDGDSLATVVDPYTAEVVFNLPSGGSQSNFLYRIPFEKLAWAARHHTTINSTALVGQVGGEVDSGHSLALDIVAFEDKGIVLGGMGDTASTLSTGLLMPVRRFQGIATNSSYLNKQDVVLRLIWHLPLPPLWDGLAGRGGAGAVNPNHNIGTEIMAEVGIFVHGGAAADTHGHVLTDRLVYDLALYNPAGEKILERADIVPSAQSSSFNAGDLFSNDAVPIFTDPSSGSTHTTAQLTVDDLESTADISKPMTDLPGSFINTVPSVDVDASHCTLVATFKGSSVTNGTVSATYVADSIYVTGAKIWAWVFAGARNL